MNVNLNTQVIFCRHKAQFLCQPLNFDLNNSTRFGDPDANVRDEKSGLVSISSTFLLQIFCTNVVSAAFTMYMQLEKAAETTFVWKICSKNVDEIDT
jgi:hypothetical protein